MRRQPQKLALGVIFITIIVILIVSRIGLLLTTQAYDPEIYRFAGMTSIPTYRTAVSDTYFFEKRSNGKYYTSTVLDRVGPYLGIAPENSILVGIYSTLVQDEYVDHYICEDITSREARFCDLKTGTYLEGVPSIFIPEGYIITSIFSVNDPTRQKPTLYFVYNLVGTNRFFFAQANDPHLIEFSVKMGDRIVGTANIAIARRLIRVITQDSDGNLTESILSD